MFHYLLPFACVVYHKFMSTAYVKTEMSVFFNLKLLVFVGFLGILILGWVRKGSLINQIVLLSNMIVPVISIIYTYSFFQMKCMAGRRIGDN